MLRVAAITGGMNVPSARFRVRQYIAPLSNLAVTVDEYAGVISSYPPRRQLLRPAWGLATVMTRLRAVGVSHKYDVTLLQREMLSTFRTLEPLTKKPRVLDLDDAIWLHRRGHQMEKIVRDCDAVICGNQYIADWANSCNSNVHVLPTAVDTERFHPRSEPNASNDTIVIGWMGQSSGYPYLETIRGAIARIADRHSNVVFRIVSDTPPPPSLHFKGVEFVEWSLQAEVSFLQSFDIGIMPLEDSPWCMGKCSYKMLLYMSCGKPVVVSDVGMNSEVLKRGRIGCGVSTVDEWVQALECLIEAPALRSSMGGAGRNVVQHSYSLRVIAPRLAGLLGQPAAYCHQEAGAHG